MNSDSLFLRIKQGELSAFNEVYKTYYNKLCYIAWHMLGDRSLAEEVSDDVLFYLWDHRHDIKDISIEGYLVQSVRHASLNVIHSAQHRNEQYAKSVSVQGDKLFLSLFADDDPLKNLLSDEFSRQLDDAIARLPEQTRRVFVMAKLEHRHYQEIADELGIVVPTVKYHVKCAMQQLSNALKNHLIFLLINTMVTILS